MTGRKKNKNRSESEEDGGARGNTPDRVDEIGSSNTSPAYVAPVTDCEKTVAEVWSGLLNLERVGMADTFLLLGGESLLAGQAAVRLRDAFNVEVSIRSVLLLTAGQVADQIAAELGRS